LQSFSPENRKQQVDEDVSRHTEVKKTELGQFTNRLGEKLTVDVSQQTQAAKVTIDLHAGTRNVNDRLILGFHCSQII